MQDDDHAYPEDLLELFLRLQNAMEEVEPSKKRTGYTPKNLHDRLAEEGNFDLIAKLQHVERQTPGFGTIVVSREGFSEDDSVHNEVLQWLQEHDVNVFNPGLEITRLERALHPNK